MDRLLSNASPPLWDAVVSTKDGKLVDSWRAWFGRMPDTLEAIPSRLNYVSLSNQTASIATTDFRGGDLLHGLYRLTYYLRIKGSGGGSVYVTLRWTDGGVAFSFAGSAASLVSEETDDYSSETILVRIDGGTAVTYETTYDDLGTFYNLDLTLEKMKVL